jgi:hypothetical protein
MVMEVASVVLIVLAGQEVIIIMFQVILTVKMQPLMGPGEEAV